MTCKSQAVSPSPIRLFYAWDEVSRLQSGPPEPFETIAQKLNPAFLVDRGIVPTGIESGELTVGMVDTGDGDTIAALRFASMLPVRPVAMSHEEVAERLGAFARRAGSARELDADQSSLSQVISSRISKKVPGIADLESAATLIDAGYNIEEAAKVLGARHRSSAASLLLQDIAGHSRQGSLIGPLFRNTPPSLRWIGDVLDLCSGNENRAAVFSRLIGVRAQSERRRERAMRHCLEIIVIAITAIAFWAMLMPPIAMGLAVLVIVVLSHICVKFLFRASIDPARIEVLGVVEAMAGLGFPPAIAIRAGLLRVGSGTPDSNPDPDRRQELIAALSLDPICAVLVSRGDLADAAGRALRSLEMRMSVHLSRFAWTVRTVFALSLGIALVWITR